MDSNDDITDLQIKRCLSLVGTLLATSNMTDCEGLCKCSGAKILGKKRVALGRCLLVALGRDLNKKSANFIRKRPWCGSTC